MWNGLPAQVRAIIEQAPIVFAFDIDPVCCPRREWPRNRGAAEQRDERAPLQLIRLHPIPRRAGTAHGTISKPEGSVSSYRGHFAWPPAAHPARRLFQMLNTINSIPQHYIWCRRRTQTMSARATRHWLV